MSTEVDLATIDAYMRDAAVHAVAEAVRAHASTLSVNDPALIEALSASVPAQQAPAYRTVTATPMERYDEPGGWWRRHWHHALLGSAAASVVGLVAWAVISLFEAADRAVSTHGSTIGGVLILGLVVLFLCSRGGGGRKFSGTFEGTIR